MARLHKREAAKRLEALFDALFYCPACTTWRTSSKPKPSTSIRLARLGQRRYASTLTSSTAINATKPVPEKYKPLYEALGDLRKNASAHVNLSRLQLALQGLESESPTIRVAVLGLNTQEIAQRIVRLLLADAQQEEARWEHELTTDSTDYSQGLLIRFGEWLNPNLPKSRTSIPVLQIPVPYLENKNIEILISSISSSNRAELPNGSQPIPVDTFLSPAIGTPTAASGRQVTIMQPVHKSLVVGRGLDELVSIAELLAATRFTSIDDKESVEIAVAVVDVPGMADKRTVMVNIAEAEEGLAAIRRSLDQGITYEEKWSKSGISSLVKWLSFSSAVDSTTQMPTPIRTLISAILDNATSNLQTYKLAVARANTDKSLNIAVRNNLEAMTEKFSTDAHQELQSGLSSAWSSRNWRKLAWYKLFWRVDDVSLIITDLVNNAYLPRTERAVYEISGRLAQAGISPLDYSSVKVNEPVEIVQTPQESIETVPATLLAQSVPVTEPSAVPVLTNRTGTTKVEMAPTQQPKHLAATISTSRAARMTQAIADLTTTAQQLVIRTFSITGLTAGLSGLSYISLTPGSLYEAGTIFAVGSVFAFWRMQGDWSRATKALENGLHDDGREAIRSVTEKMQNMIKQKSVVVEDEVEVLAQLEAENSLQKAKQELQKLS